MLFLYDVRFNKSEFKFTYQLVAIIPADTRRSFESIGFVATKINLINVLRGV
jgi:hypothetical protein